jgi:ribokinase
MGERSEVLAAVTAAAAGRPVSVAVVGSINADLVVATPHLPAAGETVRGGDLVRVPGGKGANQAVAAARLGASVSMIGAVGDDHEGRRQREFLDAAGVRTEAVRLVPGPTGVAMIAVDPDGENLIIVSPGANQRVDVQPADLTGAALVLTQLEIPLDVVLAAARQTTGLFCLNAAPAQPLPAELIERCDLLVVNEGERAAIEGLQAARRLVVTYGARGAALFRGGLEGGRELARATPPRVDAIDTVGAGDCFTAAIAVAHAWGLDPEPALRFACAAGALATTRPGARAGLPTLAQVQALL